ncbi:MAG: anthranilate synthase component I family protein [Vampirovibrionales bacterium]
MPRFLSAEQKTNGQHWEALVERVMAHQETAVLLASVWPATVQTGYEQNTVATNRWSLLGWGCRQQLTLFQNQFMMQRQGQLPVVWPWPFGEESVEALWHHAEALRITCQQYWLNELELPFYGGLVGLLHYEAAPWCDQNAAFLQPPHQSSIDSAPIITLRECEHWALFHHPTQQFWVSNWAILDTMDSSNPVDSRGCFKGWETTSLTEAAFTEKTNRLLEAIQQGDCYQANLSIQWQGQWEGTLWPLYKTLQITNPSPFSGYWQDAYQTLVCNSPERLVQVDNRASKTSETGYAQWITTRPIAGTRGRGMTQEDDQKIGQALLANEKEQAEHLMLVDLLRNDVGKVSQPGTVTVRELMVLERYAHVTHLVSDVEGLKQPSQTPWDVLCALFPGGTITGCPKVRSMQWLHTCEPVQRGPYTGSLGYVDAKTGAMDWNIIIRSLYAMPLNDGAEASLETHPKKVFYHAGAGIVADSIPAYEYRECLRKAQNMMQVLEQWNSGHHSL